MPASRPLRALLAGALLALGLVPATVAVADPATRPAPVQILPLTTSSGHVTEVGQAGLDQAASAPQAPASKDTGTQADAGTTDTSSPTPAPGTAPLVLTDPVKVDSFLVAGFRWSGTDTLPGGGAGTTSDTTDSTTGSGDHLTQPAVVGAGSSVGSLPVDVNTRADWGADPSVMTWDPEYVAAHHVVVHHTAGTNNYSAWQSASIVRGIYHYHAVVLDWGDIGYNFLVDKYGQVFEGRSGSLAAAPGQMVIGAHARGVNTGSMGISMLGDYSWVRPSDMTLDRVGKMAGWFLGRAGYTDVNQVAGILVRTTEKYQAGTVLNLPRIFGHRDSGNTACPGDTGYSMLGTIRSIAQDQAQISSRPSTNYLGWVHEGGSWYYFSSPGVMATGWVQVGENWYYLDPGTGAMVTGWAAVGSRWFYFRSDSGAMATGWIQLDSGRYYLDPATGAMVTGWILLDSTWYYLDPTTGALVTQQPAKGA